MSGVSATTIAAWAAVAGAAASVGKTVSDAVSYEAPPKPGGPPPPPQAGKDPDLAMMRSRNAAARGPAGGYSGTLLTGPTGVAPGSLSLGSSTLLGQ